MNVIDLDAEQHGESCLEILSSLPEWFGYPGALEFAAIALKEQRGWVALEAQRVTGFVLTDPSSTESLEITYLAVHARDRHHGAGSALLAAVRDHAQETSISYVCLLTLGPSSGNEFYAETREFYRLSGFSAMKEMRISDWNGAPALMFVARPDDIGLSR